MDRLDDHDRGLAYDLAVMTERQMARRSAIGLLLSAGGSAVLAGCGGGGSSSASTATTSATTTTSTATSTSTDTSSNTTSTTASSGSCTADPQATSGPYPADGTNTSQGSTSDVLTASGVVRSDIRESFISSTDTAPGVDTTITITLVDASTGCTPLAGYAIYFWQCDADGEYSLYGAANESYLRGVQVSDANGQVSFQTVFPACYSGRWPHMHFEVYSSLSSATNGANAVLTSQFAMPYEVAYALYTSDSTYSSSVANLAAVSLSSDLVFSAFSSAQLAQAQPAITGSVSAGYTATATIGLAV